MSYFDYVITTEGVKPDSFKFDCILNFPKQQN